MTRARAMVNHRLLGARTVEELSAAPTLGAALRRLESSAYRHDLGLEGSPAGAERSVGATLLWHLRVLAGWLPRRGAAALRSLTAGFEIANTEDHLRLLSGHEPVAPPYRLGALATAWPRLSGTRSPAELRTVLAASSWGDPGGDTPAAVATGMRVSAAVRTAARVPEAVPWAAGRLALLVARERFVLGRQATRVSTVRAARLLGSPAMTATSFADFSHRLPQTAGWVLAGIDDPAELWRAEARWWGRLERDGATLLDTLRVGRAPVMGAVALLCADAWRVRGALVLAARGGGSWEVWGDRR